MIVIAFRSGRGDYLDSCRNQAISLTGNWPQDLHLSANIVEPDFFPIADALRFASTLENAANG
jgi:hypothetical protein